MNKEKYIPQPIDTSDIDLSDELLELADKIAKNVHEVWSYGRLKEGWSYGAERNDAEKTHPCLIAYEDLSEEEKEYDLNTALGTLRLIVKLGFKISLKS
jgi:ryanodine receptor 2